MLLRLSGRDEARFPRLFRQMFRQRYDIFVERRRWRLPERQYGLERDRYDTPSATYFVAIGPSRTIPAGARLLTTQGPHLLADVFSHLVDGCVPRGPNVCEVSRFYVANCMDPSTRRLRVEHLSRAIFLYSKERGVTTLTGVVDSSMLPIMARHHWVLEPLGPPHPDAEGSALAIAVSVEKSLRALNRSAADRAGEPAQVAPQNCNS